MYYPVPAFPNTCTPRQIADTYASCICFALNLNSKSPLSLLSPQHRLTKTLTFMAKIKKIITALLRFIALAAALSATIAMVTSHDSAEVLNLSFDAKYTDSHAFVWVDRFIPLTWFTHSISSIDDQKNCAGTLWLQMQLQLGTASLPFSSLSHLRFGAYFSSLIWYCNIHSCLFFLYRLHLWSILLTKRVFLFFSLWFFCSLQASRQHWPLLRWARKETVMLVGYQFVGKFISSVIMSKVPLYLVSVLLYFI